jgi:hypothetical protein
MKKPMTEVERQAVLLKHNVYAMSKEQHLETLVSEGYQKEVAERIYEWRTTPLTTATTRTAKLSTKLDALRRKTNTSWEVEP